jgi:lipid A 3-O-deacylase PagL
VVKTGVRGIALGGRSHATRRFPVSKVTRWLALVVASACGTAASAQAPQMYGMQPYPPYSYPRQVAYTQAAAPYAPTSSPQTYAPQPRVMYVSATPTNWDTAPAPTTTLAKPAANLTAATTNSTTSSSGTAFDPVIVETVQPKTRSWRPFAKPVSTQKPITADDLAVRLPDSSDPTCSTPSCHAPACSTPACSGPSCGDVCPAQVCCRDPHANWLPKGHWDVQMLGGAFADIGDARYNYAESAVRFGKVWDGHCIPCIPGAIETLIEVNVAKPFADDFGSYFTGGGILLRYNFVDLGSRLVPYIQAGAGFQVNDAFHSEFQPYLGSRIELTAQAGLGLRFFLSKCLSLDIEGSVQHISNLNMNDRDEGINALGGMAGVTYFLPCCCRH